jgi:hypothetical protein
MKLCIVGKPKKIDKFTVKQAVTFFIDKLLGNDVLDLEVKVKFVTDLNKDCKIKASAYPIANSYNRFEIEIDDNLGKCVTLNCLAHEVTHVKQFVHHELVYHKFEYNIVYWQGVRMIWDADDNDMYYSSPWEIEAHGREYGLYQLFKIHLKKLKKL